MTRRLAIVMDTDRGTRWLADVRCDECAHWLFPAMTRNDRAGLCKKIGDATSPPMVIGFSKLTEFATPPGFGCSEFEPKDGRDID